MSVDHHEIALVEDQSVTDIICNFTAREMVCYRRIKEKIQQIGMSEIRGRYELAQEIYNIYQDMRANKNLYGAKFLDRLGVALGFKSRTVMQEMIRLVERWPTWEILETSILQKVKSQVRWKDLVALAKANEAEMESIIEDINSNKSVQEISRKITNTTPTEAAEDKNTGRRPKQFDTIDAILVDIDKFCAQLVRRATQSWSEYPYNQTLDGDLEPSEWHDIMDKMQNAIVRIDLAIDALTDLKQILEVQRNRLHSRRPTDGSGAASEESEGETIDIDQDYQLNHVPDPTE